MKKIKFRNNLGSSVGYIIRHPLPGAHWDNMRSYQKTGLSKGMKNQPFLPFLTGAMVKLALSWTLHTLSAHAGNRSLRRSQRCPEAPHIQQFFWKSARISPMQKWFKQPCTLSSQSRESTLWTWPAARRGKQGLYWLVSWTQRRAKPEPD